MLNEPNEQTELFLESEVQRELNNLFALQDKNLTDKKESIWIQEIKNSGIPLKAMLQGIRSLKGEDVNKLTYFAILQAARRFLVPENELRPTCNDCHKGIVLMKDSENRMFSLACVCPLGQQKANAQNLVRWNGASSQTSRGRILAKD